MDGACPVMDLVTCLGSSSRPVTAGTDSSDPLILIRNRWRFIGNGQMDEHKTETLSLQL